MVSCNKKIVNKCVVFGILKCKRVFFGTSGHKMKSIHPYCQIKETSSRNFSEILIFRAVTLYSQLFVFELLMHGSTRIFLQALVSVFELQPFCKDIMQRHNLDTAKWTVFFISLSFNRVHIISPGLEWFKTFRVDGLFQRLKLSP